MKNETVVTIPHEALLALAKQNYEQNPTPETLRIKFRLETAKR